MKKKVYERMVSHWTPKEIQELRKELKMSRADLASRLGVCERTVIRWEEGSTVPIRAFDRGFDELCAGTLTGKKGE